MEYHCAGVPNGDGYKIYPSDELSGSIGDATVSQYDTNYDQNSSGKISYGFGLVTNSIDNRFTKSSDKWSTQKRKSDIDWCRIDIYGGPNSRPLQANLSCSKMCYDDRSNDAYARIELDGHFDYDSDEKERTMYAYWHAKFHTLADSPHWSGGDAYSYYRVGVWDGTANEFASDDCKDKTYYRLHASDDHDYSSDHDVSNHCSFTAKPGHHYYVYFNARVETKTQCSSKEIYATSELDTVYYVHLSFFDGP